MPTPHISLRVPPDQLDRWRTECSTQNVDVSSQVRLLMDAWVTTMELKREYDELVAADVTS